jgi:hypothetical protein
MGGRRQGVRESKVYSQWGYKKPLLNILIPLGINNERQDYKIGKVCWGTCRRGKGD